MLRKLVLFLLVVYASLGALAQEAKRPTLTYVFDPLCSWCYTFGPVVNRLYDKYHDQVDFVVLSGGMLTGDRVRPISFISEYILSSHQSMHHLTGVAFGEAYLALVKEGKEMLDSEKPSKAVVAINVLQPQSAVKFSHELQKCLFVNGLSLNQDSTYRVLAQSFGLDGNLLVAQMGLDSTKSLMEADFKRVEDAGISGFPTLIFSQGGKAELLSEGFVPFEKLDRKIAKRLKTKK